MTSVKPWFSKTILFNVVMGVLVAITPMVAPASAWAAWMQANSASIAMVWSVLGIVLRLVTKGKISLVD